MTIPASSHSPAASRSSAATHLAARFAAANVAVFVSPSDHIAKQLGGVFTMAVNLEGTTASHRLVVLLDPFSYVAGDKCASRFSSKLSSCLILPCSTRCRKDIQGSGYFNVFHSLQAPERGPAWGNTESRSLVKSFPKGPEKAPSRPV